MLVAPPRLDLLGLLEGVVGSTAFSLPFTPFDGDFVGEAVGVAIVRVARGVLLPVVAPPRPRPRPLRVGVDDPTMMISALVDRVACTGSAISSVAVERVRFVGEETMSLSVPAEGVLGQI